MTTKIEHLYTLLGFSLGVMISSVYFESASVFIFSMVLLLIGGWTSVMKYNEWKKNEK